MCCWRVVKTVINPDSNQQPRPKCTNNTDSQKMSDDKEKLVKEIGGVFIFRQSFSLPKREQVRKNLLFDDQYFTAAKYFIKAIIFST